jgi:uncharacterized protein
MRVVLDANIYISSLISSGGNPATIIHKWMSGEFVVLVSQPIVDEVLRVTGYERLQKKYRKIRENRIEFVQLIAEQGIWTKPKDKLMVVTADESDNRYIECAVAGSASYIISGDEHLLKIGSYQGIGILTPAAFLALLEIESG